MKTTIPSAITTQAEAEIFLTNLCINGENFHPEDDAHDIEFLNLDEEERPTVEQCDQLNKLMDDIYNLPGDFCPCAFILYFLILK